MKISMKMVKKLTPVETFFVYSMIETFKKSKKKMSNYKNKRRIKVKTNHDNCTSDSPCLFDFDCPAWKDCKDEKFIQYRLIMKKCEIEND